MNIDNTNISSQIASSISKLNLNTTKRISEIQSKSENTSNVELQEIKKNDIQLVDEGQVQKNIQKTGNRINVEEIQQYAYSMGENLTIDDINYGLMYGRSVIADFCV